MSFVERQKHLLQTAEFSDFTLTVDGRDFKIHRSVVCPQSTMLRSLCTGSFQEGLQGRGTLTEENANIFEKVLEYLYTGEYNSPSEELEIAAADGNEVSSGEDAPANNEDGENETGSIHRQSEQLMFHTEVYLQAKFLGISELMRHARNNFAAVVKSNFRADAFLEPFSRVFDHGEDGDSGLRAQILELCLENSEDLSQDGELTFLLLQHEAIAWKMISRQGHKHACQLQEAVEAQQALEETLQNSKDTVETLEQRVEELTSERDRVIALLEKYDRCRNCDRDFGSYVDKHERGIMRCKGCRCRHYP
ncbi:hypothetical protein LTR96_011312 [Exophiala xenobiotica]|nr:hypothetical protein LTR41_011195 [Exophiala xenobiotica]KAK5215359.1 hypothetical protein LTR72_011581 [Exophiala xenobiotica]KAK5220364.1 hypothetical protein LTR47_011197 [Exophiala xenobiotica]KAK5242780.1 hypothetical protein LTS06_011296 [Exophiala xenobiotica]KAK5260990.1 hypothetical protein LTR40_003093 [Exophiala xenobiotica]